MKIDVYSIMRNEMIILPYFLRHYGSFANRIFVWDDRSIDGTREMLAAHPKVTVFDDLEKHGLNDVYWVEEIWPRYEKLSRGKADWVMCVDADEFIYFPNLVGVLAREKERGTKLINCQGWAMVSDGLPTTRGQIYDEIKLGLKDRWSSKWVVFSPDIHVRFWPGRHSVQTRPVKEITEGAIKRSHTGIKLLHYRYLGAKYFKFRNIVVRKFSLKAKYNMPDDTKANPLSWYERHKGEAVNCVCG